MNMPKRLLCYLTLICISGCSTLEVKKVKKLDRAAVASITADQKIDYQAFVNQENRGQFQGTFNHIDFRESAMILRKKLYGDIADILPIKFMQEGEVIGRQQYKDFELFDNENAEEMYKENVEVATPQGYKTYDLANGLSNKRSKMTNAVPEKADAVVFIGSKYSLNKEADYGNAGDASVTAKVKLVMIDSDGNKLIKIKEKGTSQNTFRLKGGTSRPKEDLVEGLMVDATEAAFSSMATTLKEEF